MKVRGIDSIAVRLSLYAAVSMILTVLTELLLLLFLAYIRGKNIFITEQMGSGMRSDVIAAILEGREKMAIFRITSHNIWNVVIIVSMMVLLFLLYYILITRPIVDEVRILLTGLHTMKKGDLTVDFPVRSQDELGEMAAALNEVQHAIVRVQQQERELEHTKDELITNVAHDLRTPLTSLKGYVDLLAKEDLTKEQREKYTRILVSKTNQLQTLIEALFEYTQYYGGEVRFYMKPMNMSCFMEQMTDEFYQDFCNADLRCETQIEQELYVNGDGDKLARAFNNIFANAIKYGKDGKLIRVSVREDREKREVVIEVVNYGILIDSKDIERLFEKFYRVEESRSMNTGGSGLGLAITKTIIERHRGKVCAVSNEEGTMIQVRLPEFRKDAYNAESME
ncbi:MAG: HAMP domain-containing sensor histidine kinase [Lachnospiraceae bacterium]|nr:HAMP domain-containing sensor histidine kinase [Lachnospiraceae bacterium]